jgi:peptidoglycan-N-acetylglucosamine deacetylase
LPQVATARGEFAVTIDDGPDPEATPAVLDLLDHYQAPATFFCIAERARRHPALCRRIVDRGHSVENHTFRHRHNFALLGLKGFRRELEAAQNTLADITGIRPLFFRAPVLRGLSAGDILLLHDGNAARSAAGRPVILEALPALLEAAAAQGLRPVTLRSTLAAPDSGGRT